MLESQRLALGQQGGNLYAEALEQAIEFERRKSELQSVVSAEQQVWERSRQGLLKHMINDALDTAEPVLEMYQQVIPAGGHSGKHRHFSEELLFVIEGSGYDLHWDPVFKPVEKYEWSWEAEPKRYEWSAGDYVWVPPYSIHQHFANDGGRVRFLSATMKLAKTLGFDGLEQLEDASPIPDDLVEA